MRKRLCHVLVQHQLVQHYQVVLGATQEPDHPLRRQLPCRANTAVNGHQREQFWHLFERGRIVGTTGGCGKQDGRGLKIFCSFIPPLQQELRAEQDSPLWMLNPLGSYFSIRLCTCSGLAGGKRMSLRRVSRCFLLMNFARCSLVM